MFLAPALLWIGAALVTAVTLSASGSPQARTSNGAVYTASNSASGNQVLMFDRDADGALAFRSAFPTGGTGSGNALGNQGGLVSTADGKFLLVVNAGSNEISVLAVASDGSSVGATVLGRGRLRRS
jgi:6-phosphogluconolactonase (cycloisomerase 2 family)